MSLKLNGATSGSVELDVPAAIGSDLSVTLPATAGEIAVKATDGSVDLGDVSIDSSGRLLVGTSSTVPNDLKAPYYSLLQVKGNTSSSATDGRLTLFRGESSTSVSIGKTLGYLMFADQDGGFYASILGACDGTVSSSSDTPGRLVFSTTADGASSPTERMRITSGGAITTVNGGYFTGTNNGDVPYTNPPIVLRNTANNTPATVVLFKGWDGSTSGSITTRVNVTAYNTSSDYRLKENIVELVGGIDKLKQLKPKSFSWVSDNKDAPNIDGFIAHEVQNIIPEAVTGIKDEIDYEGNPVYQGIDQSKLVPLLTAALQEAITKIETLEAKVAALEGGAS